MSKQRELKEYQLRVWYNEQNGDNPQNGFILALHTDSTDELYRAVARLDKDDEYYTTKTVMLRVQAI